MVRAYVAGEAMPLSDPPSEPPPESEPPESESDPPEVETSVPRFARARMVELGPDMTIRPRRTWTQQVKDWAETLGHAQKIVIAVVGIGGALTGVATALYKGGEAAYRWYATRPSAEELDAKFKACGELVKSKADQADVGALRAEVADAGAQAGDNWDKQDEINRHVHGELTRFRKQTPPASLGPKAKAEGRH
jgi:hypothetical protein